jgi:hypothetical protein
VKGCEQKFISSFLFCETRKSCSSAYFRPRLVDVVDSTVYRSHKSLIKSAFMLLGLPPVEIILFINFSVALLTFDAATPVTDG